MRREGSLAWNPAVAVWEVSGPSARCSARSSGRRDAPPALSTAEAFDLIAQLEDLDPGMVVLTGDDPFDRADLYEIIQRAVAGGLRIEVAPGGTRRLTPDLLRHLAALGVARIGLGVDGPDAAGHDRFCGTPGSFEDTRRAIDAVQGGGLSLHVTTTLACETVQEIARTAGLIATLVPSLWTASFVVPGPAQPGHPLGPDSCERVFAFLAGWTRSTGIAVETAAAPAYRRVVVQSEAAPREGIHVDRPLPVNDGKGLVHVSHTGDVYPSAALPLTTENVRETPLPEVYRSSRLFRALRDETRLQGKCGVCAFRSLCGGSRARAYATTGNFLAEDPACARPPARFELLDCQP
jgi:radical SAM protein with 4Fe4S-binding SPASM domain